MRCCLLPIKLLSCITSKVQLASEHSVQPFQRKLTMGVISTMDTARLGLESGGSALQTATSTLTCRRSCSGSCERSSVPSSAAIEDVSSEAGVEVLEVLQLRELWVIVIDFSATDPLHQKHAENKLTPLSPPNILPEARVKIQRKQLQPTAYRKHE